MPVKKLRAGFAHIILIVLILLVSTGILGFIFRDRIFPPAKDEAVFNFAPMVFAPYQQTNPTIVPKIPSYLLTAAQLPNLSAVEKDSTQTFSGAQTNSLSNPGFFLGPSKINFDTDPNAQISRYGGNRIDDMIDLYKHVGGDLPDYARKPENTVFITSDLLLHTYHLLIDRSFQKIESAKFQPQLTSLTQSLFTNSLQLYKSETNPQMKESLKRLTAFYLVPLVILDSANPPSTAPFGNEQQQTAYLQKDQQADSADSVLNKLESYKNSVPPEILGPAKQELELVMGADKIASSPIYGNLKKDVREDYTQFKPRSHYTKSSALRTYFRAMIWYGRVGFYTNSPDLTRDAMTMTWQLGVVPTGNEKSTVAWQGIYLPTVFFVGQSDDLTFMDYSKVLTSVFGSRVNYVSLRDAKKQQEFLQGVQKLPSPQILSQIQVFNPASALTKQELVNSTKGLRFMGQRFVPDAFIFSSLTQGDEKPDPETGQRLPSTPTALMVMSVLGSKTADGLLNDWVVQNAPDSGKVITKVKGKLTNQFSKFDENVWTQNIYWGWLYNLLPLFDKFGPGFPMFMQNEPWMKKDLLTALGSWTELKHDTQLYAKQSFAELGGGGEGDIPPVPKGYVEPNLSFMSRLIALNKMTLDGLSQRNLLDDEQKGKFQSFADALNFFQTFAQKELTNSKISDEDFEKLRTYVEVNFPGIVWPDNSSDVMSESDARVGLIADVHTDAKKGQILYEAIGIPATIYVAIQDINGTRLTRGAVYTYYEFAQALGSRLTDQDWQKQVYGATTPPQQPAWGQSLYQ